MSAYIASRRSARGEPPAPPPEPGDPNAKPGESEKERLNRIVAANLGLNKTPTFGDDPKRGGGVFQIKRLGYDDAEFFFNGWSKDIGRIARQLIEVRKGANPDIRLAVVRKIIEIIRSQEAGRFRLGVAPEESAGAPVRAPGRQCGARRLPDARVLRRRAALAPDPRLIVSARGGFGDSLARTSSADPTQGRPSTARR